MRTILVRVTAEESPSHAPVIAAAIVGDLQHRKRSPGLRRRLLEFGAGDSVRCKLVRPRGPGEFAGRQRMVAAERVNR